MFEFPDVTCKAALINVIIKECLFYFFKRLCLLNIQYDIDVIWYFQGKVLGRIDSFQKKF